MKMHLSIVLKNIITILIYKLTVYGSVNLMLHICGHNPNERIKYDKKHFMRKIISLTIAKKIKYWETLSLDIPKKNQKFQAIHGEDCHIL